jgi:hypothetical protein
VSLGGESVPSKKRDILVRFDEGSDEIIFYAIDENYTKDMRAREFDGARADTNWLKGQSADDAEKSIGGTIFSLIDVFSIKKINIRNYKELNDKARDEYVSELELKSAQGDAEAKYSLFIE